MFADELWYVRPFVYIVLIYLSDNKKVMERRIVRLWAEYESNESSSLYLEPISFAKAKILIEEFFDSQEEKNNLILYKNNSTHDNQGKRINMNYISKERMDQLEEIIEKIEREYKDNQNMTLEEGEEFIMQQDSW
jgi:excinuclease UvrABC ATPase subunit